MAMTRTPTIRRIIMSGSRGWIRAPVYAPARPPNPSAMPGWPVRRYRAVLVHRQDREGDDAGDRGHEGGRQSGRSDLGRAPPGADQDRRQDRAAADAVDTADAAHGRRQRRSGRDRDQAAPAARVRRADGVAGQGQPDAQREQHRGDHEVEDLRPRQQLDPDD